MTILDTSVVKGGIGVRSELLFDSVDTPISHRQSTKRFFSSSTLLVSAANTALNQRDSGYPTAQTP
jgi:hypothetical protein